MASAYDFKNISRDLASLQKEFDSFEKEFDSTIDQISKARFNSSEYGAAAIEKRVDRLVSEAKKEINNEFNSLINGVNRHAASATSRIESEANGVVSEVNRLNNVFDYLSDLNKAFSENDYAKVVSLAQRTFDNDKLENYVHLVLLESYDRLCSQSLKNVDDSNFKYFEAYYDACNRLHAVKHQTSANRLMFMATCEKAESSKSDEALYPSIRKSLLGYRSFSAEDKKALEDKYDSLYRKGIKLFNDLCLKSFDSFDYAQVKSLLSDSSLFEKKDIENDFFKEDSASAEKMFSYVKSHAEKGSQENVRMAFDDTLSIALSAERSDYCDFWFSNYDRFGWEFCEEIIGKQENRLASSSMVSDSIIKAGGRISKASELLANLANGYRDYLKGLDGDINFDDFVDSAIAYCHLVEWAVAERGQQTSADGIKTFDGVFYGMLAKYRKLCVCYPSAKIEEINGVLDSSSTRLYKKPSKVKIVKDSSKAETERTNSKVKLATAGSIAKTKALAIGLAAVALIIVVVVLIVVLK